MTVWSILNDIFLKLEVNVFQFFGFIRWLILLGETSAFQILGCIFLLLTFLELSLQVKHLFFEEQNSFGILFFLTFHTFYLKLFIVQHFVQVLNFYLKLKESRLITEMNKFRCFFFSLCFYVPFYLYSHCRHRLNQVQSSRGLWD